MYTLGNSSTRILSTGVPQVQAVVRLAITLTDVDFSVVEVLRSEETQRENIVKGVSWTMASKHLTGEAVDIYPWVEGKTSHAPEDYKRIAKAMFAAAQQLGIEIEWGGFWRAPRCDRPHWQLA